MVTVLVARPAKAGGTKPRAAKVELLLPPSGVLGAACLEVLFAVANAALHDISALVSGISSTSMSFSGSPLAVSLAFSLQVAESVVVCPEEAFSFSFPKLLHVLDHSTKLAHWLAGENSPGAFRSPVLKVDVLGGGPIIHVLNLGFWYLLVS